MKKIAVLRCLRVSASCAGTGCLKAFNAKEKQFAQYADEPLEFCSMFTCNGCGEVALPNANGEEQKKLDRMVANGINVVHTSSCTMKKVEGSDTKQECPHITEMCKYLEEHGVKVWRGTHH